MMKISLYLASPKIKFIQSMCRENLKDGIELAASCGYDGVEILPNDFTDLDPKIIKETISSYKLELVGISSAFLKINHGLSISDPDKRRLAIKYLKKCIDYAWRLECPFISIGLIRGKRAKNISDNHALNLIVDSLRNCGKYAEDHGVFLLIEPENRYETDFIHTVEEGVKLIKDINLENVKLMVDTFHMNIEERSIEEALDAASRYLLHVHVADSNRLAPRMGHFDFKAFFKKLRQIGYNRFLGVEIMALPEPEIAARKSINFIRRFF